MRETWNDYDSVEDSRRELEPRTEEVDCETSRKTIRLTGKMNCLLR